MVLFPHGSWEPVVLGGFLRPFVPQKFRLTGLLGALKKETGAWYAEGMNEYEAYNVSALLYHIVCQAKYRQVAADENVDGTLIAACEEIGKRFEIDFLEIGAEGERVHFLAASASEYSPEKIVRTIKTITAKEIFKKHPELKKQLWGGKCWSDGYCISTTGEYGNKETLAGLITARGKESDYKQLYRKNNECPSAK
jgi:REP element-mobilizing transposase RayT